MTQFDPRSRELIAYGEHNGTAPVKAGVRYHAVHYGDHITYAVDPRDVGNVSGVNDDIYIKTVDIKGVTTHSNVLNRSEKFAPLNATRHYGSDVNPYDYAWQLENGDYRDMAEWKLTYGIRPSVGYDSEYRIVLNDLTDIALNTNSTITVTTPAVTLTIPTTALLRYNQAVLVVRIGQRTATGFIYYAYVEGDGQVVFGTSDQPLFYEREFKQRCVLTELQEYMLKNRHYEEFIAGSNIIGIALGYIDGSDFTLDDSSVSWQVQDPRSNDEEEFTDVDVQQELGMFEGFIDTIARFLGAIGSMRTALSDYVTRDARYADMENTSKNIGGDIVGDKITQSSPMDWLVEIDYPVVDQYMIGNNIITPANFAQNEAHKIDVHRRFSSLSEFLTWLNNNYGTTQIIGISGGLVVDYNNYNDYWKQMIDRGLLL